MFHFVDLVRCFGAFVVTVHCRLCGNTNANFRSCIITFIFHHKHKVSRIFFILCQSSQKKKSHFKMHLITFYIKNNSFAHVVDIYNTQYVYTKFIVWTSNIRYKLIFFWKINKWSAHRIHSTLCPCQTIFSSLYIRMRWEHRWLPTEYNQKIKSKSIIELFFS